MPGCARAPSPQIYGLSLTTIAKGAFLIRASIIFTPLLCTLAGEAVPAGLWAGAVLGFAGSVMISFDSPQGGSSSASAAAAAPAAAGDGGLPLIYEFCLGRRVGASRASRTVPDGLGCCPLPPWLRGEACEGDPHAPQCFPWQEARRQCWCKYRMERPLCVNCMD